jgi:adenosylhomocysteinase
MDKQVTQTLAELGNRLKKPQARFFIVEDGGFLVPVLHKRPFSSLLKRCIGAVEQTTRGLRKDRSVKEKRIPILNVAGCKFKLTYEPPFVAEAVITSLRRLLPDTHFAGKRALVVGFGAIGTRVAERLNKDLHMRVYVAEKDSSRLLQAKQSEYVSKATGKAAENIHECELIVGTTGDRTIGREEIVRLQHGTYLASTSSEQIEVDTAELRRLAGNDPRNIKALCNVDGRRIGTTYTLVLRDRRPQVHLLADGLPINFYGFESVPSESIDPVISLLFLCSIELLTNKKISRGIQTTLVDKIVEREQLAKTFMNLQGLH